MENATGLNWNQIEKVVSKATTVGLNVLLYGPPGTGKSWCARNHGVNGGGMFPLNLTEDSVSAEARGYDRMVDGQFKFCEGPALLSWRMGSRLVLEEIEKASGDMYSFLLGVLDDQRIAATILPDGKALKPKKGFHCVATSNCESPDDLPEALRDRLSISINVTDPHPDAVKSLDADLRLVASRTGLLSKGRRCSIRAFQTFGILRQQLGSPDGVVMAAKAVFGPGWQDVLNTIQVANAKAKASGCCEVSSASECQCPSCKASRGE